MAGALTCTFDECERPAKTRGYCGAHYMRLIRYGDPSVNNRKIGRRVCDVTECDRFVVAHGKCERHRVRPESPRRCKVESCDRPHKGHGYCRVHLMRLRKHGDAQEDKPIVERGAVDWLKAHVSYAGDDCLTWPFTRTQQGAGSVTRTVIGLERGNMSASRAMCFLAHGKPPTAKHVAAHYCGNGHQACVNPRHLRWATQAENMADTLVHGTRRTLVQLKRRSLTAKQIAAVRLLEGRMSEADLAAVFGVDLDAIGRALGRASASKVR